MTKPKTTKIVAGNVTYERDPVEGMVTVSLTGDPKVWFQKTGMVELLLFSILEEAQLLRHELRNSGVAKERK